MYTTAAYFAAPLSVGLDDPHGFVLTLTAVCVVFAVLMILWTLFGLLGKGFQRAAARRSDAADIPAGHASGPGNRPSGLVPESSSEAETAAAIATAIHLYLSDTVHDSESFVITLRGDGPGRAWSSPERNFRKTRKP